jgi:hypothetical protein
MLVLYVQGKLVNFDRGQAELTGIVAAETNPSGATLQVVGAGTKDTPGAVRFLKTGTYTVRISKPGYRPWQKDIAVVAGKVVHANPHPAPLTLLKDTNPQELATSSTLATTFGNTITYTTSKPNLVTLSGTGFTDSQNIELPSPAKNISTDTATGSLLALGDDYIYAIRKQSRAVWDATKAFPQNIKLVLNNDNLLGLRNNGQLAIAGWGDKNPRQLAENVADMAPQGTELYYLETLPNRLGTLHHAMLGNLELLQDQILATNIPLGEKNYLYIDTSKAVFLLSGSTLLRINQTADIIAEGVTSANTSGGSLAYTTPGELWWYDSFSNKAHLVSRSSEPFSVFFIDPGLQYAFFAQLGKLTALELDDRAGQNRYVLDSGYNNFSNVQILNKTSLLYKADEKLKLLVLF